MSSFDIEKNVERFVVINGTRQGMIKRNPEGHYIFAASMATDYFSASALLRIADELTELNTSC